MSFIKRLIRILVLWTGPLVVGAGGFWLYMQGGRIASTDNAYLKAEMVSVSSELSGRVTGIMVEDNQRVEQGQLLFRLDDAAYHIALARTEANLLKVRSNIESLRADFMNKQADIRKAETDLGYFTREFERLARLAASESVSEIQVDQARHAAENAQRQLDITRQGLEVIRARLIDPDLPIEEHPDYLLALVEKEKAELDLRHTEVHAPAAGVIAHFEVKPGEVVAQGIPLFSIVNDDTIWVEANYKETDLTWMREGQSAMIEVDAYPGLQWQGKVLAITPGTGSEFSLLPAQNSSGNWVKVVQRVRVKISMEPIPDQPELTPGMSSLVEVDTGHNRELPWK
jgi:membrane fusion protein (multidrug efflux system)